MADVRGASGTPAVAQFTPQTSPTPCTPIYIDLSNGKLYVLVNGVVTQVGGTALPGLWSA